MKLAVGRELGDDAAGDDVDVLKSLEHARERTGVGVSNDPQP